MKKRISIIIAFALTASIAFTACGKSPEPTGSTSVAEAGAESSSQSQSEPSSETESIASQSEESSAEEGAGADIAVFAVEMQEMLDALSGLYGDTLTIKASTEGDNTLIITYTLLKDDPSITIESITESMETEGSKMENLASQMKATGLPSPVVIVKWIGTDGSELFSQEYK